MKFTVQHGIGGLYLHEENFDTQDPSSQSYLEQYCYRTGRFAKDIFAFTIFEQVYKNQKNYFECEIVLPVQLIIRFGSDYTPTEFRGDCSLTFDYYLKAADPGYFQRNFSEIEETIANEIIGRYQKFGILDSMEV